MKQIVLLLISISLMFSCQSIPKKAVAINNFDVKKYLGKWYEIARFDFKFERGLNNTTATYTKKSNGTIGVLNRGFNYEKKYWKEAKGKAKFRTKNNNIAELKVSFFGPFYAGYNVIAINGNYDYALVAGSSLDYLWILSRTTSIPKSVKDDFLKKAKAIGYDTSRLLWIEHDKAE